MKVKNKSWFTSLVKKEERRKKNVSMFWVLIYNAVIVLSINHWKIHPKVFNLQNLMNRRKEKVCCVVNLSKFIHWPYVSESCHSGKDYSTKYGSFCLILLTLLTLLHLTIIFADHCNILKGENNLLIVKLIVSVCLYWNSEFYAWRINNLPNRSDSVIDNEEKYYLDQMYQLKPKKQ